MPPHDPRPRAQPASSLPPNFDAEAYRNFVAGISTPENLDAEPFFTRDQRQAAIATEYLFLRAGTIAVILTYDLEPEIYGSPGVCKAVLEFLDRSLHVKQDKPAVFILHESDIDEGTHPLLLAVREYERIHGLRDCITMVRAPPEAKISYNFHFVLVDSKHYRFSSSKLGFESIVKFNDFAVGEKIYGVFLSLWKVALDAEAARREANNTQENAQVRVLEET